MADSIYLETRERFIFEFIGIKFKQNIPLCEVQRMYIEDILRNLHAN